MNCYTSCILIRYACRFFAKLLAIAAEVIYISRRYDGHLLKQDLVVVGNRPGCRVQSWDGWLRERKGRKYSERNEVTDANRGIVHELSTENKYISGEDAP